MEFELDGGSWQNTYPGGVDPALVTLDRHMAILIIRGPGRDGLAMSGFTDPEEPPTNDTAFTGSSDGDTEGWNMKMWLRDTCLVNNDAGNAALLGLPLIDNDRLHATDAIGTPLRFDATSQLWQDRPGHGGTQQMTKGRRYWFRSATGPDRAWAAE